jgi:hypothetical protein
MGDKNRTTEERVESIVRSRDKTRFEETDKT